MNTEQIAYFDKLIQNKLEQLPRAIEGKSPIEVLEKICQELRMLKDAKEQLALCNVSCSLPSKEAVTLEAYKQAEEMKKQNDKVDKFAYSCGYIDGYEKCKSLFETD